MAFRSKRDYYPLTYIELVKHAHTNLGAKWALDTYHKLRASGVDHPEIQCSRSNGYRVRDPHAVPPKLD
jgi:hypothetical protein